MKKALSNVGISCGLLLLTQAVFATGISLIPARCPDAASIQAVGVSQNVTETADGFWLAGRRNQFYGTPSRWTLLVTNIPARTSSEAYRKASAGMATLTFDIGPLTGPIGKWICYYHTAEGYRAMAINPPIAQLTDYPL